MGIRSALNNNPAMSTIAAVCLLLVCGGTIIWQVTGGGAPPSTQYYYDLKTGEVFVNDIESGRIKAPAGDAADGKPAGVPARIYACGPCGDYRGQTVEQIAENGAELVYLELPMKGNARRDPTPREGPSSLSPDPIRITRPSEINWVSSYSRQGKQILSFHLDCEQGQTMKGCHPGG